MAKRRLSAATIRALSIIKDKDVTAPKQFAKLMWPDSECWTHHTNCGHGVSAGGGMNIAAGGYLGRLRKTGLISQHWRERGFNNYERYFELTEVGLAALQEANDASHER